MRNNMTKIAVIGATGAVGQEIIKDLEDCAVSEIELVAIASAKSAGSVFEFRDREIKVQEWDLSKTKDCDYVLMSAGEEFSRKYAWAISEQGSVVIDNSSAWRENKDVPLIVPEVNGDLLSSIKRGCVIANPNCAAIQLVMAIAPLVQKIGIDMVVVSTYQSVSGKGQKAIVQLQEESHQYLQAENQQDLSLAFNIQSSIGPIDEGGHCEEEKKIIAETRKILRDDNIDILATSARVPVFNCHCESIAVRMNKEVSVDEIKKILSDFPGVKVCDEDLPTLSQIESDKRVWISRIRKKNPGSSRWLQFWSIADNLKKGAASNTVQIFTDLYERAI
jgi:aspartate-semialdehyde dehydrogenase